MKHSLKDAALRIENFMHLASPIPSSICNQRAEGTRVWQVVRVLSRIHYAPSLVFISNRSHILTGLHTARRNRESTGAIVTCKGIVSLPRHEGLKGE